MASLPDDVYHRIKSMMHPRPSGEWEPIHHQRLGNNTDVYLLTEGVYDVDCDFAFAPEDHGQLKEEINGDGRLPLMRFGLALVRLSNGTNTLLDAGLGAWDETTQKCDGHPVPERPARTLLQIFRSIDPSLSYNDINFVVYSHCHGDHVGWATSFPNAIHCMHKREYDYATYVGCPWRNNAARIFGPMEAKGNLRLLGDGVGSSTTSLHSKKDVAEVEGSKNSSLEFTRLTLDEEKAPGISLLLVDGHTPGHVCVEIADGNDSAIYIGDSMHFPLQVEHPNISPFFDCCTWKLRSFLPIGGDNVKQTWSPFLRSRRRETWNESTSVKKRTKVMSLIARNKSLVVSPHFPPPGVGYIQQSEVGEGFVYTPLSNNENDTDN